MRCGWVQLLIELIGGEGVWIWWNCSFRSGVTLACNTEFDTHHITVHRVLLTRHRTNAFPDGGTLNPESVLLLNERSTELHHE